MAQAQPAEKMQETPEKDMKETNSTARYKLNAQAAEFVPRSHTQMPISDYVYPAACFHFLGGSDNCFYVGDQEPSYLISNPNVVMPVRSKSTPTDDLQQKIIKQVTVSIRI
jgi:La-related protein 7